MVKRLNRKNFHIIRKVHYDRRERYICLILKRNNQKFFYKELNNDRPDKFKEQIDFQKRVEESQTEIILPKLIDYKLGAEKSWALWEYLPGKHLADWKPKKIRQLANWLEPIVEVLIQMLKIKPLEGNYHISEIMLERAEGWSKEPVLQGFYSESFKNKIIFLINKNHSKLINGFNHSDFVPWHMHELKFPKFYLVDYENCKGKPLYYDLAHFYHRLYTKLGEPKIADKFLEIFFKRAKLPPDFEAIFSTILGHRIMAGFFDCLVNKDGTDIKLHQKLLDNYLKTTKNRKGK